jgi:putative colanic acid biosynthesis acetyltransferase WcaF
MTLYELRGFLFHEANMINAPFQSKVNLQLFDSSYGLNREASILKEVLWYIVKWLFFLTAIPYPSRFKTTLLKIFGARVGKNVLVKPRVNIHMPWKLVIGNNAWIGEEVFILNFEPVHIGNNVCISQRVFLCGGNHNFKDPAMAYRNGPITLNDGCWIGASTFVCPDVSVGVDTVVCAASVVTRSLNDNGVFRGNPAGFIKMRWE